MLEINSVDKLTKGRKYFNNL